MDWLLISIAFFALAYTPELADRIERWKAERRRRKIVVRIMWGTKGSR